MTDNGVIAIAVEDSGNQETPLPNAVQPHLHPNGSEDVKPCGMQMVLLSQALADGHIVIDKAHLPPPPLSPPLPPSPSLPPLLLPSPPLSPPSPPLPCGLKVVMFLLVTLALVTCLVVGLEYDKWSQSCGPSRMANLVVNAMVTMGYVWWLWSVRHVVSLSSVQMMQLGGLTFLALAFTSWSAVLAMDPHEQRRTGCDSETFSQPLHAMLYVYVSLLIASLCLLGLCILAFIFQKCEKYC